MSDITIDSALFQIKKVTERRERGITSQKDIMSLNESLHFLLSAPAQENISLDAYNLAVKIRRANSILKQLNELAISNFSQQVYRTIIEFDGKLGYAGLTINSEGVKWNGRVWTEEMLIDLVDRNQITGEELQKLIKTTEKYLGLANLSPSNPFGFLEFISWENKI